jgi:hypothetical protein
LQKERKDIEIKEREERRRKQAEQEEEELRRVNAEPGTSLPSVAASREVLMRRYSEAGAQTITFNVCTYLTQIQHLAQLSSALCNIVQYIAPFYYDILLVPYFLLRA